jgi:mono/diheme cytochrome c family protein
MENGMAVSLSFRRTMATIRLLAAGISSLACLLPVAAAWAGSDNSWKNGEEVYAKVCGYCHQTGIGPVIKGRELPPEYTAHVVRHGLRAMPAFPASFIDDQALQEVAGYLLKSAAERK